MKNTKKISTLLHKNKIARVLLYAVLEWFLIFCLLLNGLFSYLIAKFAAAVGLPPPCLFCSRVDHLFDPPESRRRRRSCRDFLCESHADEVSKLGFCSSHGRLAEAAEMCEDCSAASRPAEADVVSWMQRSERGEKDLRCSCCDVVLESGFYYLPFKLGVRDDENCDFDGLIDGGTKEDCWKVPKSDAVFPEESLGLGQVEAGSRIELGVIEEEEEMLIDCKLRGEAVEGDDGRMDDFGDYSCCVVDDDSLRGLGGCGKENYDGERLVPVELIDEVTVKKSPVGIVLCREFDREVGVDGKGIDVNGDEFNCMLEELDRVLVSVLEGEDDDLISVVNNVEMVDESYFGVVGPGEDDMDLNYGCAGNEDALAYVVNNVEMVDRTSSVVVDVLVEDDSTDRDTGCAVNVDGLACVGNDVELVDASYSSVVVVGVEDDYTDHDLGCAVNDERVLASVAETDIDDELNCSREEEAAVVLDRACLKEEITVLDSEMNDVAVVDSLEILSAEEKGVTLDVGIILEEDSTFIPAANENDIVDDNSLGMVTGENFEDELTDREPDLPQLLPMMTNGSTIMQLKPLLAVGPQDAERDSTLCTEEVMHEILQDTHICEKDDLAHKNPDESVVAPQAELDNEQAELDKLPQKYNEITDRDQVMETETVASAVQSPEHVDVFQEISEVEEERLPETPTQLYGIHSLHKRFMFGRRESGVESLDGSVTSDVEGCELSTVEQLKSALQTEHRALSALYAELEEERNASAIAANQTMAMITRLQEEKATMQMEALQYQRMMEEQSEYDQELLHHLNELLNDREKEKQDLEDELEVYRKKYLHYKAYKRKMEKNQDKATSETFSDSSGADDDLSLELGEGNECHYSAHETYLHTSNVLPLSPGKVHLNLLDNSLADFKQERHSILSSLRTLEERLLALDDENCFEATEHSSYENGHVTNGNHEAVTSDEDSGLNILSDYHNGNGKLHSESRNRLPRGKMLLPLFDAIHHINGDDDALNKEEMTDGLSGATEKLDEQEKLATLDKVDIMNAKAQTQEVDGESQRHYVSSLRKGDKALHLLQEILEQLRQLRNVELQMLSNGGGAFSQPALSAKLEMEAA